MSNPRGRGDIKPLRGRRTASLSRPIHSSARGVSISSASAGTASHTAVSRRRSSPSTSPSASAKTRNSRALCMNIAGSSTRRASCSRRKHCEHSASRHPQATRDRAAPLFPPHPSPRRPRPSRLRTEPKRSSAPSPANPRHRMSPAPMPRRLISPIVETGLSRPLAIPLLSTKMSLPRSSGPCRSASACPSLAENSRYWSSSQSAYWGGASPCRSRMPRFPAGRLSRSCNPTRHSSPKSYTYAIR